MNILNARNLQWHVIYVRPKFERRVQETLIEKSIQVFLPMKEEIRQWHDRKKKIETPVFPGYMFVHIDRANISDLYSVSGFMKFISTAGIPDVVSDSNMKMIKKILEGQYEPSDNNFLKGEKVRVLRGAFKGLEGVLVGEKGTCRLAVKIEVVDQYVVINARAEDLEKIVCVQKVA